MRSDQAPGFTQKVLGLISVAGLIALAISAIGYAMGIQQSVAIFLGGMIFLLGAGVVSALRREGGATLEDILTVLLGLAFFCWIAWKHFLN
ncbi:hypothetical protein [Pseudomonas sp. UMC65]|uniref:hypothetical protein n=1 Tax=Pseudomonas sp. UMC65 TaxID=1862323 RepID=UPI0015FF02F8|nr:hypothetical protein [Pseudomonas sp. UMC65]